MTERQLLERFVTANDPDAFKALIERHGPMVLAVCRNVLHKQHDVEDAFQETFLALARYAHTIKHNENIGPWLYGVALRRALRCPVGTIKGRLWRARQTLRDRLSRRGLDSYSGPPGATPRG